MPLSQIILESQPDGRALTFVSDAPRYGCLSYRQDGDDFRVQWHPRWGWCITDPQGTVTGLPLGLPKVDQRHRPPEGPWLNRTLTGSQVFDLRWPRSRPALAA